MPGATEVCIWLWFSLEKPFFDPNLRSFPSQALACPLLRPSNVHCFPAPFVVAPPWLFLSQPTSGRYHFSQVPCRYRPSSTQIRRRILAFLPGSALRVDRRNSLKTNDGVISTRARTTVCALWSPRFLPISPSIPVFKTSRGCVTVDSRSVADRADLASALDHPNGAVKR